MANAAIPVLRALLSESGYHVAVRTDGWFECLLLRDSERWVGHGRDEAEALEDAVGRMLPSRLAWALLEQRIDHALSTPGDALLSSVLEAAAPPTSSTPEPREAAPLSAPVAAAPLSEEPAAIPLEVRDTGPTILADEAPAVLAVPLPTPPAVSPAAAVVEVVMLAATPPIAAAPIAHEPPPAPVAAVEAPIAVEATVAVQAAVAVEEAPPTPVAASRPEPARAAIPSPPPSNVHRAPPEPRMRASEAIESVEKLLQNIEDQLGRLARMSSERQRLHMLRWICRARAVEEGLPGVRDVEHATARVARRLTEIGKMFWPGSVRALQLSARPADVRREMHATWAAEPENWRSATDLAERLLEEHMAKSADLGLDEDGWADVAARTPKPTDPDALFEEVDKELKEILVPPGEVPNGRLGELSNAEFETLLGAARKLRWLRGNVKSDLDWGVAMGRLRRAVPGLGDRAARIRDVLDHRAKQTVPWAKVLGEHKEEPVAPPGESPEVLKADLPPPGAPKDDLMAWLVRAFDVLNTPVLVDLLRPHKADIAAFGEDVLNHPDRRIRRRLRDLAKRVAEADEAPVVKEPEVEPEEAANDEPMAAPALVALSERVRQHTKGSRALFVSNREDPELGARLTEMLGITITWCDGSLRRVQAQCERITRGSYDIILSATGFQVHGVDSALASAARAASVAYVRVNRGRPVACIKAIAREFGIISGTFDISARPAKASAG
jgi:hypothetical protein